jgi:hypothetical protein
VVPGVGGKRVEDKGGPPSVGSRRLSDIVCQHDCVRSEVLYTLSVCRCPSFPIHGSGPPQLSSKKLPLFFLPLTIVLEVFSPSSFSLLYLTLRLSLHARVVSLSSPT